MNDLAHLLESSSSLDSAVYFQDQSPEFKNNGNSTKSDFFSDTSFNPNSSIKKTEVTRMQLR